MKKRFLMCVSLAAALLTGCSGMSGTSSLTLLTNQNEKMNKYYKAIGPEISEKECVTRVLFFWFGTQPIHESLLAKMLEQNKADVLLNSDFSVSYINAYFFDNYCAKITGTPAILKGGN